MKYRADVLVNGVKARRDLYKKLAPVDRDHQANKNGTAPERVRVLANLELAPMNAGLHIAHSGDTVTAFPESFLAKGEGGSGRALNPTTRTSYRNMYNALKPFTPQIELRQVRTPHIDKWLRDVSNNDGADRRAKTSYANMKTFLSSAFRYAVRHGLIDSNPVRDTAIPQGLDAHTHAYTLREVHGFMSAINDHVSRAAFMVCMFTGLRIEEVKGLRWEDYDGEVLNIRRAVVNNKLVEVKTDASKAPVPVIGTVKKVLAAHLKRNSGDGYIFHGETGQPVIFENLSRRYIVPTHAEAGLTFHGWHAFRRGLASYLEVNLGLSRESVKRVLRHAVDDVTGKHYVKSSVDENRKALQRVEKDFLKLKPALKF